MGSYNLYEQIKMSMGLSLIDLTIGEKEEREIIKTLYRSKDKLIKILKNDKFECNYHHPKL